MKARKRLALIGPMYPYRGGIAHFLETMFSGLKDRGHEVSAWTFTRQYPTLLFPGKTQLDTAPQGKRPSAHRILDSINPLNWLRAARTIGDMQPDVVIFKYWMPFLAPAFGTVARRLRGRGCRVVVVVDNAIPHERHLGDAMLGRYFLRATDGCIVMSEAVRTDLRTLGTKGPVHMVPHPVYDLFGEALSRQQARSTLQLPPKAPVLLFFGLIRRYKGLHVLLDAMPRIVAAMPEARLIIAGECYDDEQRYRDQIRRHGLEHHVRFDARYIPDAEVPAYFSACDVVVQPYVTATQSGVAQIAFNFEVPLIITDVGGLAEVVRHDEDGLVVPPEAPQALADAVMRFFREDLGERFTTSVKERKRSFGWSPLLDAVELFL